MNVLDLRASQPNPPPSVIASAAASQRSSISFSESWVTRPAEILEPLMAAT